MAANSQDKPCTLWPFRWCSVWRCCLIQWTRCILCPPGSRLSTGREEAFEIFMRDREDRQTIEDNKAVLKQRLVGDKDVGLPPHTAYIYFTTCKISSANMAFWSSNIQQYYTVQQLIAVGTAVVSAHGYRRLLTVERRQNKWWNTNYFLDLFVQLS